MVIVSKGIVEHVDAIKSVFATSGLIMGTPQTNSSMSGNGGIGGINLNSDDDNSSIKSTITQCSNRTGDLQEAAVARCILFCQPNSHPFQTRTLFLEPNVEVKVGRSIARSRVSENNAIFDCKVLSRNHAVIWYSDGKFYVKDTRSSNGTFINERRISQSEPEELSSGDIVKFGVDVIENSRKEVHGCIIACVKLFSPEGRSVISTTNNQSGQLTLVEGGVTFDELHRLQHFMQETSRREKMLEIKLHDIQKVIELTRRNASTCWHAMIDEDRLLNRIDVLESKLKYLQKHALDDELKDEILKLQEDKCLYQNSAKEALHKVYQERLEAVQKLTTIERALCSSEDECSLLRDQLLRTQQNLQEVSSRLTRFENECKEYRENNEKVQSEVQTKYEIEIKLKEKESELEDYKNQISALITEKTFLQRRLGFYEGNENTSDDDTISKTSETSSNRCTVKKWLENSDLNHREGSADIIKAICEDTDCYEEDTDSETDTLSKLEKIKNKLSGVEKKLVQLTSYLSNDESNSKVDDSTTGFPSATVNDGNQNIQQPNKLNYDILKTTTTTLMEICNEAFEYVTTINNCNKIQKDYKKLESKLLMAQAEINNLQLEIANRPTYNQIQEKINLNECLEKQLNLTYKKVSNLEDETTLLKEENQLLQKRLEKYGENYTKGIDIAVETNEKEGIDNTKITDDSSNVAVINDIINSTISAATIAAIGGNNDNSSSTINSNILSSSLIESSITYPLLKNDNNHQNNHLQNLNEKYEKDDLDLINDKSIQQEEELIIFKEKYEKLLNENLDLKNSIMELKQDVQNIRGRYLAKLFMYGTLIVAIASYFISLYN